MNRLLALGLMLFFASVSFAQEETQWSPYFQNDELKISMRYQDCHYPEKGVHSQYVLLKMENLTTATLNAEFELDKWYNNKKINPDSNGFKVVIEPNGFKMASCDNLENGLHIFSKILEVEAKSVLSRFEVSELTINGKIVQ